ncbi:MAG TPA: PhzF family phenazine biosynthesis protein [Woeseiaceae bacterium]|nr:PhzF family phenazine biosynthesis protein [Woeseiaceae bacterium]
MAQGKLYRLSAFADGGVGGNPAGVWIGEQLPDAATMQAIAADVGYSETAFIAPTSGRDRTVRYYSPEAEVSFCGHATIASGVVLGRENGEGTYTLSSAVGKVTVSAARRAGQMQASLVSVDTRHEPASAELQQAVLSALHWSGDDLDQSIPPVKAYAGAWHLVLAANSQERLADLDYDFETLKSIMLRENLTTLQLICRENDSLIHARNPFPVGGVVEDPATGAAAAALGGYLRDSGLRSAPFSFTIRQGVTMGRPSVLSVDVPAEGGVMVSGSAIDI